MPLIDTAENEDMRAVTTALKSLVSSSSTLMQASHDPKRCGYVDQAFDDINRVASAIQMILTCTLYRQHKHGESAFIRAFIGKE